MNQLTELRTDIANALNEAGIRSVDYGDTKLSPNIAVVVPGDDYISQRSGDGFGEFNIGIRVLLIGPKATPAMQAKGMDDLILKAFFALNDHFDIVRVSPPDEVTLNGTTYFGAVLEIDAQLILREDV